jgi:hypothetical protein
LSATGSKLMDAQSQTRSHHKKTKTFMETQSCPENTCRVPIMLETRLNQTHRHSLCPSGAH